MSSNIRNYVDQNRNESNVRIADDAADTALQTEIDQIETGAGLNADGTFTPNSSTNYIASATSIKHSLNLLDVQIKTNTDDISGLGDITALQTEIDHVETGAGLNNDGTYTAPTGSNYIDNSSSLKDADNKLDSQIKTNTTAIGDETTNRTTADSALQTEIDDTQTGAGLDTNGDYSANIGANYISVATSLKDADNKLDSKLFNLDSKIKNDWVIKTTNYTMINGDRLLCDTSSSAFTITLPQTPTISNEIEIIDLSGDFDTNNLTVSRNGSNIMGLAQDLICDVADARILLTYTNSTEGWKIN